MEEIRSALFSIFYLAAGAFVLGTAVGSFLNVWSRRLLRGKPPTGRSRCEHCRHGLGFFDLIPLLSFFALGGRCRYCKKPLSWQYPLVELGTGLLFALLTLRRLAAIDYPLHPFEFLDFIIFSLLLVAVSALIVIFITDFQKQVIFDQVLWVAVGAALLLRLFVHFSADNYWPLAADLLAAFGTFGFFWLVRFVTRGRGMGEGDPPLGFAVALLVGFPAVLAELFLAFVLGGLVGGMLVLLGKSRLKDRIAFGPFLTAAAFLTLLFGDRLLDWYLGILG